jgi:pimeloyl-ACP methyl ester carboxylesterase
MGLARTLWRGWVAALTVSLLAACASPYRSLVSENSVPELKAAKDATQARGKHVVMAPTLGESGPNVHVAVHELEAAQTDRILVFIHGVFADHETWRFVAGNLARDHGVWLVDMPGCGQSEAPSPLREESYTVREIAERTLQALRYCLSGNQTPRLALVGHSYGAAVIVRMFGDSGLRERYADVLSRIDRLVLISPLDIALSGPAPVYRQIAEASATRMWLAGSLGVLQGRVARATIASVPRDGRPLREEAEKKVEILRNRTRRQALQAMITKAVPWTSTLRPEWDAIEVVESMYAEVDRECLIVVGTRDEALPASMSYKMAVQLPRTCFVPLRGVMHSPHIEAHDRCVSLIREFVTTGRVDSDVLRPRGLARP